MSSQGDGPSATSLEDRVAALEKLAEGCAPLKSPSGATVNLPAQPPGPQPPWEEPTWNWPWWPPW